MVERSEGERAKRKFALKIKKLIYLTRSYASRFLLRFAAFIISIQNFTLLTPAGKVPQKLSS
jgi:hypothetical protein